MTDDVDYAEHAAQLAQQQAERDGELVHELRQRVLIAALRTYAGAQAEGAERALRQLARNLAEGFPADPAELSDLAQASNTAALARSLAVRVETYDGYDLLNRVLGGVEGWVQQGEATGVPSTVAVHRRAAGACVETVRAALGTPSLRAHADDDELAALDRTAA